MICSKCSEEHPIEEMELTFRRPDASADLSAEDRADLVQESNDLCIIEGKRFFIRAPLPLNVEGRNESHCIGLWVEVNQAVFKRAYDLWESEEQLREPRFAALIANEIPTVVGSLGLELELQG